jgi:transmembrane sensor
LEKKDLQRLERYIKGEMDDNERMIIESMFNEANQDLRIFLERDWETMLGDGSTRAPGLNHLLDRIHHSIRLKETNKEQQHWKVFISFYMKLAAVLIPFIVAGNLIYFYYPKDSAPIEKVSSTLNAPVGSRIAFSLPDGTTGMLNGGSQLSYSMPFNEDRNIELDGEAWFEVKHDKEHPFRINAVNSTIEVLGTSFNVAAYESEDYLEIVLMEGKVGFHNAERGEEVILTPSERLIFNNHKIVKDKVDPGRYKAWIDGKLVFRGDKMSDVARRIEKWFNVNVIILETELENYSFYATFDDDSLEDVLDNLCMTSPMDYKIIPPKKLPDDSISKREIHLYKAKR